MTTAFPVLISYKSMAVAFRTYTSCTPIFILNSPTDNVISKGTRQSDGEAGLELLVWGLDRKVLPKNPLFAVIGSALLAGGLSTECLPPVRLI